MTTQKITPYDVMQAIIAAQRENERAAVKDLNPVDYVVYNDAGEIITNLNMFLAKKQNITREQLEALKLSHQFKWILFEAAKNVTSEPLKLRLLAALFDALEFEQQELWNFERDASHHLFWTFPGCSCPQMDNEERRGIDQKIYSSTCPIHGNKA